MQAVSETIESALPAERRTPASHRQPAPNID